ncbi:TPA: LPXTG cell wall anchor domain-containing protein [Streptococcus agalactiae]|uniref:LPXTG cell wall anchor domain-containing protein n=1 Tax=Streptococcus agalactiae TaxID=1311 RepID=UPI00031C9415|nr:LPXTG cell wall anchor domain-containing protein [Streptococcus agalactiae]SUN37168.1 adhesion protein [Streptococcus agalactiae]HEO4368046.1 LPXTG cell wall anchor domain-containing protein [Streptococcus agalactiae]HEO7878146.1 LPXTG cell wall anchor domain-containing protein [Streptococcus agalactiae]
MNQIKIITGLTVATLSAVVGNVYAEDITPTAPVNEPQVSSETAKTPQVTESQVNSAKVTADQATSDVNAQKNVVNNAQNQKNQAQQKLVNATTTLNETQKLVQESTNQNQVQQTVDSAKQRLSQTEANQKITQTEQVKAQNQVNAQQTVVVNNEHDVATKTADVKQAQASVDTAKDALTNTIVNSDLNKAQSNVTTKTADVKTATDALTKAQATDKTLTNQKAKAQQIVDSAKQNLSAKDTQLSQANAEVNHHKFKTALGQSHYYNQRDNAWAGVYGGHTFASTGCVPSALAMVYSDLSNRTITPREIADYLYNNTDEFNKRFGGTSGKGIISATKAFGYVVTHLASKNAITEALKAGHHVVAAVQNNKFSPWGPQYSHEIVLRGSSNGNTYVYDPYNRDNNGFYSVDRIWNEQSRDSIDTAGVGVPFFAIMTKNMANALTKQSQALASQQVAQKQLNDAQAKATGLNAVTMQTPIAQANLIKAQSDVAQAKDNLANKIAKLQREVAYLQELKTKAVDAQSQYQKVLSAYKSVLSAKASLKLAEEKARLDKKGHEAVAVVDETGKITSYITSKHKIEMKSLVATKTTDVKQVSVAKASVLPSTGDVKQVSVALLGMLLTFSGFLGIRKQSKKVIN